MSHQVTFELGDYQAAELEKAFEALAWKCTKTTNRVGTLFSAKHKDHFYGIAAVEEKKQVTLRYDSDIHFADTTLGPELKFLKRQYQTEVAKAHVAKLRGKVKKENTNPSTGVTTLVLEVAI